MSDRFSDGLAMGSPLALLMASVFMDRFEKELFKSSHPLLQYAEYRYRYVDDVLCLWSGGVAQSQDFLQLLNNRYTSIKFTLEIGGVKINFLDLTISIAGKHEFEIFRQPTTTDTSISNSSYHNPFQKTAAFLNMIHRLLSVPLSQEGFQKEVDTITYLAKANNYHIDIQPCILQLA